MSIVASCVGAQGPAREDIQMYATIRGTCTFFQHLVTNHILLLFLKERAHAQVVVRYLHRSHLPLWPISQHSHLQDPLQESMSSTLPETRGKKFFPLDVASPHFVLPIPFHIYGHLDFAAFAAISGPSKPHPYTCRIIQPLLG